MIFEVEEKRKGYFESKFTKIPDWQLISWKKILRRRNYRFWIISLHSHRAIRDFCVTKNYFARVIYGIFLSSLL